MYRVLGRACIGCRICPDQAPALFRMRGKMASVLRQPVGKREIQAAEEAMELCPTGAILRR